MHRLFGVFIDICLLRAGPQDLPASGFLAGVTVLLHWLLGVLLSLYGLPPALALVSALLGTLLLVAVVHGLLALRGLGSRFHQTLTAMAGCELLLGLFAFPLMVWYYNTDDPFIPSILSLGLLAWGLVVSTHILRHALNVPAVMGFVAALGYTALSYSVAGLVAGG